MSPIKNLAPVASWFLKFSLGLLAYQKYFSTVMSFSFNGLFYFIALLFVIFTILILLSEIVVKQQVTVIAGLGILILSVGMMFYHGFSVAHLQSHFIPATLGLYFVANGK